MPLRQGLQGVPCNFVPVKGKGRKGEVALLAGHFGFTADTCGEVARLYLGVVSHFFLFLFFRQVVNQFMMDFWHVNFDIILANNFVFMVVILYEHMESC